MEKYKGKYRIPSARASWKNYADKGTYFVSVNTKYRFPHFGHIQKGIMCLSKIGSIAYNEWLNTLTIRPDMNLTLHAHVIMPDHFHAVLSIGENKYNAPSKDADLSKDALLCVSLAPLPITSPSSTHPPTDSTTTGTNAEDAPNKNEDLPKDANSSKDANPSKDLLQCVSLPPNPPTPLIPDTSNTFGPQRKNLAAIMRGYKSTVTVQSRKINPKFGWQTRFYDIIVPNEQALKNIIRYINHNPKKWSEKNQR